MITCQLKGGLGNQLFQVFAVIAYSLENNFSFKFFHTEQVGSITPRHSYWSTFLKSLRFFLLRHNPPNLRLMGHAPFNYVPIQLVNGTDENICFDGYFQSHKYFESKKKEIYRLIQLEQQQVRCLEKHNFRDMTNTICMHFRLGDYKHLGHTHPIMSVSYYKNALTHILSKSPPGKYRVLYFCEKEDNEYVKSDWIQHLLSIFPTLVFEKVSDEMADWEQLMIMSQCTHNIIANSSFSWFGAYFNAGLKHQLVCYPHSWFAGDAARVNDTSDMFPARWEKIVF